MQASDSREEVALAEDAHQFSPIVHNQKRADIAGEHDLNGFLHAGRRTDCDRFFWLEDVDRIFHETALDPVLSTRPVELRQIHRAVTALFTARQIIMATIRTNHRISRVKRGPASPE